MELAVLRECYKCHVQKPIDAFSTRTGGPDNLEFYCRECIKIKVNKYLATLEGYIVKLLCTAKNHAKTRKNRGRAEAGVFDLTREDVRALWESQNGKCFYSKINMSIKQNTDWQCSLERLDPEKGYIVGNVALCCQEFNGPIQWSIEKINSIKDAIKIDYVLPDYNYKYYPSIVQNTIKQEEKPIAPNGYFLCTRCNTFKPNKEHSPGNGCKACKKKYDEFIKETPRRHLQTLVNCARTRGKEFKITYEDIVEIYKKQNGLCAYSKIPMTFGSYKKKDWICSLERKDVSKGYVKDNVCLVCFEFNAADRKNSSKKEEVEGGASWSEKKFKYFMTCLNGEF